MFPFIGIHANEEPRTEISPSGLYATADSSSLTASSFSQDLLSGRGEFTFMFWGYIDATSGTLFISPYEETTAIGQSSITVAGTGFDYISVSLKNANGGTTSLTANVTIDYQEWFHIAVTGSVINGRVRAYYNGLLVNSATMTYANAVATSNELNMLSSSVSTAQWNVYGRELSESEVLEHIADDGTNGVGVLSYDAMDANQRQGLIYCASFIKDISISGNEFTDKSGNNISISQLPSLTGEPIYAYTALGGGSQTFPVSSSSFDGSGSTYYKTQTPVLEGAECVCIALNLYLPDLVGSQTILAESYTSAGNERFGFKRNGSTLQYVAKTDSATVSTGLAGLQVGWNTVGVTHSLAKNGVGTDTVKLYINGAMTAFPQGSATMLNNTNYGTPMSIGTFMYTAGGAHVWHLKGDVSFVRISRTRVYNDTEMEALMTSPANCLDLIDSSITDDLDFAIDGGTFTGNDPLLDQISGNNLTEVGSFNYVDRGLEVECGGGSPTTPTNALPSNLPTTL